MIKDWSQADFVEVIYVLLDVLPYFTELSLVFQELEFDVAIVQMLVNIACHLQREVKTTATVGWGTAYLTLYIVNANCFEN